MKRKKPYDKYVYRSLALVMQFGINMVVPIAMTTALGIWLDRKLGTSYIMIPLFFVGAVAGGQNVYRMARKIYGSSPEEPGNRISGPGEKDRMISSGEKDRKQGQEEKDRKQGPERKKADTDENNRSTEGKK